jgi:hypothetical protein
VGHVAQMGMRNAYNILVGIQEGNRPLGRPRHRWDDIRTGLRENDRKVWTGLIWLRRKTSGGLLWTRQRTFGFHKIWGIS